MNIVVILVSTILMSTRISALDRSVFMRSDLAMKAGRNSHFNQEIVIKGSQAENVYVVERTDLTKAKDDQQKKLQQLGQIQNSPNKQAQYNLLQEKLGRLLEESKVNKFCSEVDDICPRAFKNSYFSKNNWTWKADSQTECLSKKVSATKNKNSYTYKRHLVACDIETEIGVIKIYLESSMRYVEGKNLRFFVMTEENGEVKPVAYLMNKKEPKEQIKPNKKESENNLPVLTTPADPVKIKMPPTNSDST